MKKVIVVLFLLMLILTACGAESGEPKLEIMRVDADGMNYVLNNYSNKPITFGAAQGLEVLRDGSWQDVESLQGDIAVIAILYELAPGGVRDCGFYWQDIYGSLPAGQYRLVKHIECGGEQQKLTAEFVIE